MFACDAGLAPKARQMGILAKKVFHSKTVKNFHHRYFLTLGTM